MQEDGQAAAPPREMRWPAVLWFIHLHAIGIYGFWLLLTEAKWMTVVFVTAMTLIGGLGITAGAHRLWAHGTYTGSWPLRLFLMLAHTSAGVGSIFDWVVDHRIHHKFYGQDVDPYDHKKGFIYSHILANLMTKPAGHENAAKQIPVHDIENDGYVMIQRSLYWVLMPIVGILLPINAPAEYWGESILNSVFIMGVLRLVFTVNMSWLVNSATCIWGLNPGDKYPPDDNSVFFVTRSYWPHYHYIVPWDYKSGEFGTYDGGCTTTFIKIWKLLGLAKCLKTAKSEDIREALAKVASTGSKLDDCLQEVHESAEENAARKELAFKH
ncbi:acyl-CoA Delta-9 desaturase [Athalia rosae]|uniref:acyl-CoA Delta-9 desaturase n=1 Tax=Athalia rosae TaxID=37344 RepID=UPI00203326E5|nr:acyl-CoA Delta-9 desaturase [Athalia rosae]XP_048513305.1 acyl-CoA Delta-9 desaturase [Athalia rosae]